MGPHEPTNPTGSPQPPSRPQHLRADHGLLLTVPGRRPCRLAGAGLGGSTVAGHRGKVRAALATGPGAGHPGPRCPSLAPQVADRAAGDSPAGRVPRHLLLPPLATSALPFPAWEALPCADVQHALHAPPALWTNMKVSFCARRRVTRLRRWCLVRQVRRL